MKMFAQSIILVMFVKLVVMGIEQHRKNVFLHFTADLH